MSKKKLFLIPALILALTSCGGTSVEPTEKPVDPSETPTQTPTEKPAEVTVKSVEITNKDSLTAEWFLGGEDRSVNYKITTSDGKTAARGGTITSSNLEVVTVIGSKIHAAGPGTSTITVEKGGVKASVDVTVKDVAKEKEVSIAECIAAPVNDATAYIITGYITGWSLSKGQEKSDATDYGNFFLGATPDAKIEDSLLVYGATEELESLTYNEETKLWSWTQPNKWDPAKPFPKEKYSKGDQVKMKGLRLNFKDKIEFNGIVLEHKAVEKAPVTSIEFAYPPKSLGNGYAEQLRTKDNNGDDAATYAITAGDAATITETGLLTADATKTGEVTITATSKSNPEVKVELKVNIVANPETVKATLAEVIADESGNGAKLFEITAKTVANDKTSTDPEKPDLYGNFDWTDGTNKIASYGLSLGEETIKFVNDTWKYKNNKTFGKTGVEIGSETEYKALVMRADYTNKEGVTTKQLVGRIIIDNTAEPEVTTATVAELKAAPAATNKAYTVTGYLTNYNYGGNAQEKGTFFIGDKAGATREESMLVYGATEVVEALTWDTSKLEYVFDNPAYADPKQPLNHEAFMLGDKVTMKVFVGEHKGETQLTGIITSHEALPRPNSVGLIGAYAGHNWDVETELEKQEGGKRWAVTVDLVKGDIVKLRANDDWKINWGFNKITEGAELFKAAGADYESNIEVLEDGRYTFVLDVENDSIKAIKEVVAPAGDYLLDLTDDTKLSDKSATYNGRSLKVEEGKNFVLTSANFGSLANGNQVNLGTNKTKDSDYKGTELPAAMLKALDETATADGHKVGTNYVYAMYMDFDTTGVNTVKFTTKEYNSGVKEVALLESVDGGATYTKVEFVNDAAAFTYTYTAAAEVASARYALVAIGSSMKVRLPMLAFEIK